MTRPDKGRRPGLLFDSLEVRSLLTTAAQMAGATQFVTNLYYQDFGHGPDAAGLQAWVGAIDNGLSERTVANEFANIAAGMGMSTGATGTGMTGTGATGTGMTGTGMTGTGAVGTGMTGTGATGYGTTGNPQVVQFVTNLYYQSFGHGPDATGLQEWVSAIDNGLSLQTVESEFANIARQLSTGTTGTTGMGTGTTGTGATGTGTGTGLTGTSTNGNPAQVSAFVTELYQSILGRAPDAPGLAAWTNAVDRGLADETTVINDFLSSPERQSYVGSGRIGTVANPITGGSYALGGSLTAQQFVDSLYSNLLNRQYDAPGEAAWVGALNNGRSAATVLNEFLTSAEYSQLYPNAGFNTGTGLGNTGTGLGNTGTGTLGTGTGTLGTGNGTGLGNTGTGLGTGTNYGNGNAGSTGYGTGSAGVGTTGTGTGTGTIGTGTTGTGTGTSTGTGTNGTGTTGTTGLTTTGTGSTGSNTGVGTGTGVVGSTGTGTTGVIGTGTTGTGTSTGLGTSGTGSGMGPY